MKSTCGKIYLQKLQSNEKKIYARDISPASEAHFVNDNWKYKSALSLPMMRYAVENRPSSCVAVKDKVQEEEEEELASFLITRQDGAMSCLYTLEKYRGKGYASVAARDLALKIIEKNQNSNLDADMKNYMVPYCYIVNGNDASEKCFSKLGFEKLDTEISWFLIAPAETTK